jgi:hypothetical protein
MAVNVTNFTMLVEGILAINTAPLNATSIHMLFGPNSTIHTCLGSVLNMFALTRVQSGMKIGVGAVGDAFFVNETFARAFPQISKVFVDMMIGMNSVFGPLPSTTDLAAQVL